MQPRLPLPSAMSLDLPLIPDVPAGQNTSAPLDYSAAMYSTLVPNSTAMPGVGDNYNLEAQPNSEVSSTQSIGARLSTFLNLNSTSIKAVQANSSD